MADGTSQVFTTQSILDSGAVLGTPGVGHDGHYGNPTNAFTGQLDTELFAFVNIFATNPNAKIKSLLFEQARGRGEFESDNHTVCADILNPDTGTPIPQTGSITIVKEANPESEQVFDFATNIGGANSSFTLVDNGSGSNSTTFSNLPPTEYDVRTTEQLPEGWNLDTIVCSGGNDIDIVEASANVQINLAGGEDVTCTFTKPKPTVPVTLGWFLAEANGDSVDFRWQTSTETANAGFNLYGEGPDGLIRLNDALIPSSVVDSVEPTDYAYTAVTTATVFYVEELSLEGMTDQIGPFELGREYGVYVATGDEIAPKVWLPIMVR